MKDDRKKLMPEVLPQPAAAVPSATARQRVLRHMKLLIATGAATTTLAACPYGVVDPLPPPARCRTTGSVLDVLQVTAELEPDGAGGVVVRINVNDVGAEEVRFLAVLDLTGATVASSYLYLPVEIRLKPDRPDATIDFKLAVECAGAPANKVHITLRPGTSDGGTDAGTGPYTVTVTDGGP